MRDAFGGVFMMRLMLAFIIIFVAFSAVSLNYAKAFKIKNQVIDLVEQQEILNINDVKKYFGELESIANNASYNIDCSSETIENDAKETIGFCHKGIIITVNNEHPTDTKNIYYNIITYGGWNLESLNMILTLGGEDPNSKGTLFGKWRITGEAKVAKK